MTNRFPITVSPTYGARKISRPSVRIAQFGDGFQQRSTFGINQNLKIYSLTFQNISFSAANEIEDFLDARAGVGNFSYAIPDLGTTVSLTNSTTSIITGTYSQSASTTITITTAGHGLSNDDEIYVNFTSGNAPSGFFTVTNSATDTFDVTSSSASTSGSVAVTKPKKFICLDWNRTVGVSNRATITATFQEEAEA